MNLLLLLFFNPFLFPIYQQKVFCNATYILVITDVLFAIVIKDVQRRIFTHISKGKLILLLNVLF
jgi:hypothetical protein